MTGAQLVELKGITRTVRGWRGARPILRGVTCSIPAGRVVGLLGRNGAGKTTLLRVLMEHVRPETGSIRWADDSKPRRAWLPEGRALGSLGGVEQWERLFPAAPARRLRCAERLEIESLAGKRVRNLSGGERRRLELFLTLGTDASVFFLDEPTLGLDPVSIQGVKKLISELVAEGATVVVSTHLLAEFADLLDDVVVLREGRVVFEGRVGAGNGVSAYEVFMKWVQG